MADQAHNETDRRLNDLERRLQRVYANAYANVRKTNQATLKQIDELVKEANSKDLRPDPDTLEDLMNHARQQISQLEGITYELQNAAKLAERMIRDEMLNIYELNYTGQLLDIGEQLSGGIRWDIYDKEVIKLLMTDSESAFTKVAFERLNNPALIGKRTRRVIKKLQNRLAEGIISGESIPKIARGIRDITGHSFEDAVRIARTETTRAQNGGRMAAFGQAANMGIAFKKQWISTLDSRTRDTHAALFMETAEQDKPFSNGLMHPGDPKGPPAEVINCRCTVVAVVSVDGYEPTEKAQELEERLGKKAHKRWKADKNSADSGDDTANAGKGEDENFFLIASQFNQAGQTGKKYYYRREKIEPIKNRKHTPKKE